MRPSAMVLDGWSLQDLRALPDRVLHWLAQLPTLIEEMRQWPTLLAQGYTSLIPKPGEERPLGTRPLTVLSMVYGLWAGTGWWEVMRWQEAWIHPRAYGFPAVREGLPLLGAQRDTPQPRVRGDPPGPLSTLGKAIHRPTKALVAAADGEQRVRGPAFPRAPDVGVVRLVLPGVRVEAWVVWGGGRGA